jgi:hypothetical protein
MQDRIKRIGRYPGIRQGGIGRFGRKGNLIPPARAQPLGHPCQALDLARGEIVRKIKG